VKKAATVGRVLRTKTSPISVKLSSISTMVLIRSCSASDARKLNSVPVGSLGREKA